MRKYGLFGFFTAALVALDQWSKHWTVQNIGWRDEIHVIDGWFSLVYAENPGAAFSFMADNPYRMHFFIGFTLVAVAVLGGMLVQLDEDEKFQATSLGVLMAGVVGNLIDRVRQGYVVDMFKAYTEYEPWKEWLIETFRTNVWPIFNVADICINLGVGLILFHYLFLEGRRGDDEDVEVDAAALPPVEA